MSAESLSATLAFETVGTKFENKYLATPPSA
jgi:hypothetical protein